MQIINIDPNISINIVSLSGFSKSAGHGKFDAVYGCPDFWPGALG